jgi:Mce-associated membrane protein
MPPVRPSARSGPPARRGQTAATAAAAGKPPAITEQGGSEHASSEHASTEHASTEHASTEHASTEPSAGAARAANARPAQTERTDERPARTRSRTAAAPAEPDSPGQPPAARKRPAAGERHGTGRAATDTRSAPGQPAVAERDGAKPAATRKRAVAERPAAAKPAAKAVAERDGAKPAATRKRAVAERPAAAKPAAPRKPRKSPAPAESAAPASASPPPDAPGADELDADRGVPDKERDVLDRRAEEGEAADQYGQTLASARRRHSPLLLPAVLAVVTVVLGVFAVWSGVRAHSLTSDAAGQNTALTDGATTTKIIGQVTSTAGAIFSYDYADPARTQRAGQRGLTGQAVQQYRSLFRNLQREAARYNQLVLTTTVTDAGVETLQGNSARVLIFANQVLTSASQNPQSFGSMVALDVVQQGGTWKIDDIDTFTGAR